MRKVIPFDMKNPLFLVLVFWPDRLPSYYSLWRTVSAEIPKSTCYADVFTLMNWRDCHSICKVPLGWLRVFLFSAALCWFIMLWSWQAEPSHSPPLWGVRKHTLQFRVLEVQLMMGVRRALWPSYLFISLRPWALTPWRVEVFCHRLGKSEEGLRERVVLLQVTLGKEILFTCRYERAWVWRAEEFWR